MEITPPKAVIKSTTDEVRKSIFASKMWIFTLLALVIAITSTVLTFAGATRRVTIEFNHGRGIRAGDSVRYLGIEVGRVGVVRMGKELNKVEVVLDLDSRGAELAREGTLFWIERPQFSLTKMSGLDTIAGGRYIAVLPGEKTAPKQNRFVGREQTRPQNTSQKNIIDVTLHSKNSYNLKTGAPVRFRGIEIGLVESVGLSSDSRYAVLRLSIEDKYRELIRSNTKFWSVRGLGLEMGILSGVKLDVESISTLLDGGIAISVPDSPGARVATGYTFTLHAKPEKAWLNWNVPVAIGPNFDFGPLPRPERISISWKDSVLLIPRNNRQSGWHLKLKSGLLLAPLSLLNVSSAKNAKIEFGGKEYDVSTELKAYGQLGAIPIPSELAKDGWAISKIRKITEPEDALIVADPNGTTLALSAGTLLAKDDVFYITDSQFREKNLHGAVVVSRADGALIGILVAKEDFIVLAPIPETLFNEEVKND